MRGPKDSHPEISQENLHELVERSRLRAALRDGKHDTVRRLRTDPGFRRAVVEHAINIVVGQRGRLFQAAMNACLRNRPTLEHNLRTGKGLWVDEMQELSTKERAHVLVQLRKQWNIPAPEQKTR